MIIRLTARQIKKIPAYKMSYNPEPDSYGRKQIKIELNLFNYGVKSETKKQQVLLYQNLLDSLILLA